jgi:hypothetical protein
VCVREQRSAVSEVLIGLHTHTVTVCVFDCVGVSVNECDDVVCVCARERVIH